MVCLLRKSINADQSHRLSGNIPISDRLGSSNLRHNDNPCPCPGLNELDNYCMY